MRSPTALTIAIVGSGRTGAATTPLAEEVGKAIAEAGATLVCGGLGGVMAAAAESARAAGGRTVGILPGTDRADSPPNDGVDVAVFTGIGQARNLAVVLTADAVIAVGGGWGTLSEIALARKHGRPVVLLGEWLIELPDADGKSLAHATDSGEAVALALELARAHRS